MQVTRMDNGLGIKLPDSMVAALKLHEGDEVEITLKPVAPSDEAKHKSVAEMLVGLRQYRGSLPADFKFDRDEANARR